MCEEEVCVCEGTVYYVVDIILYILEEVCEEEVCVKKRLYILSSALNMIFYILYMKYTYYVFYLICYML